MRSPVFCLCTAVICAGCSQNDSSTTTPPGATVLSEKGIATVVADPPVRPSGDPESVEATPARELVLGWVGNVGVGTDDPYEGRELRIRGEVIRVTPRRWSHVSNFETRECTVWLHGDAAHPFGLDEAWIECQFLDTASVEALRCGQVVVLEGRYV